MPVNKANFRHLRLHSGDAARHKAGFQQLKSHVRQAVRQVQRACLRSGNMVVTKVRVDVITCQPDVQNVRI
jgi:O-acetyl-ADP-ribose deacetylase (regulator of RNase III)